MADVEYANWWSRLFFRESFERQFVIPVPPPRWSSLLLNAFERSAYPRAKLAHLEVVKPIFIIGLPRSGTTMLFNLLCAHEQAAYVTNCMGSYPDALVTIDRLRRALDLNIRGERYLNDSLEIDFGSPSELMTLWGKWTGRTVDELDWESHPVTVTPEMIARAREDFQRVLYAFGGEARRVIAKNPVIQPDLLTVQAMFPDAKFVHIVRDGRMAANSLLKLQRLNSAQVAKIRHPAIRSFITYPRVAGLAGHLAAHGADSLACAAHVWQDTIQLVRRTAPALTHFYEFRYEDLLASPRDELERLLAFCELPWPDDPTGAFARQFEAIGRIHHHNRYGDFALVERLAGATLRQYGYMGDAAASGGT